jgi:hypothetical protein
MLREMWGIVGEVRFRQREWLALGITSGMNPCKCRWHVSPISSLVCHVKEGHANFGDRTASEPSREQFNTRRTLTSFPKTRSQV